jgi:protein TonB
LIVVAYRSHVSLRARTGAIAATLAIHVLLLLALLSLSRSNDRPSAQSALQIVDLRALPPPKAIEQPPVKAVPKPAARALRSMEKQVSKPEAGQTGIEAAPKVQALPSPIGGSPNPVSSSPGSGSGPGGGGSGGNGAGGSGSASNGGDDLAEPPRLVSPVMSGRDFSRDQLEEWPRGATVFLRLRVDPQGFVAECIIDRGTGVAAIDSAICNMAHERLRFRPALNRNGQKVAGWFGYAQPAPQ